MSNVTLLLLIVVGIIVIWALFSKSDKKTDTKTDTRTGMHTEKRDTGREDAASRTEAEPEMPEAEKPRVKVSPGTRWSRIKEKETEAGFRVPGGDDESGTVMILEKNLPDESPVETEAGPKKAEEDWKKMADSEKKEDSNKQLEVFYRYEAGDTIRICCPRCGVENRGRANFCGLCGLPLRR